MKYKLVSVFFYGGGRAIPPPKRPFLSDPNDFQAGGYHHLK